MNPEFLITPLPTFYIRNPNLIYADLYHSLIAHLKKESSHKTLPPSLGRLGCSSSSSFDLVGGIDRSEDTFPRPRGPSKDAGRSS